jgi:alkylation response protein AidB-like acyl-CoA dehydrogenase
VPGNDDKIERHASDALETTYLPKLVAGTWTGAMALTEAQAGSDLGLLRAKAEPGEDGSYRISGSKIFISAGDHDLAENIIHLALARLTGAPQGTRGISLFLVPKFIPGPDGALGPRNDMSVGALEHKMGINASPTCPVDEPQGKLLGQRTHGEFLWHAKNRTRLRDLFAYIEGYYNPQRIPSAIGYVTPEQAEAKSA